MWYTYIMKKLSVTTILFWVLLVTLAGSIAFAAYKTAVTPSNPGPSAEGERLKSDYVLMLVQCTLGLIVMFLPSLLEKRFHIRIPNSTAVLYFIFLYCAIYLGEVRSFYYVIPHWDTFLHAMSAMMLGSLGFSLVQILNDSPDTSVHLSPRFVGLFAFCFAVAVGALWEIYEFSFDGLLQMNMQKFRLENGTELIGRAALSDTMEDIITDVLGALVVSVGGAWALHFRKQKALAMELQNENPEAQA